MSLATPAPLKETIIRFRIPGPVARRLEADARRMGLRVAEVARMRLAQAVTADEPSDDDKDTEAA